MTLRPGSKGLQKSSPFLQGESVNILGFVGIYLTSVTTTQLWHRSSAKAAADNAWMNGCGGFQ